MDTFGDLYTLSVNEYKHHKQYRELLPEKNLVYRTSGVYASGHLDEPALKNFASGMTFSIKDETIFLPW